MVTDSETRIQADPARPPGPGGSGGKRRSWRRKEQRTALLLVAPAFLIVAGVYLYPAVATLVYSTTSIDIGTYTVERFVGLGNFTTVVESETFRSVLLRTIYFGVMVSVFTVIPAFFISLLLNQQFPGRTVLRVVVLLPWAVPPVVAGVLWTQMFQSEYGFLNAALRSFGLDGQTIWLGEPHLALHALIIAEVWRWLPFATLFLLAGLQTIPRDVYEAADLDGAGPWQRMVHITLPLMGPMIIPVVIFLFVWAMKAFDTIFVLTRGGPRMGTTTLNYLVYQQGFEQFRFGRAAATAYLLTLLTLVVIMGLTLLRRYGKRQVS